VARLVLVLTLLVWSFSFLAAARLCFRASTRPARRTIDTAGREWSPPASSTSTPTARQAALSAGCRAFVTTDRDLPAPPGLRVLKLRDYL
jgi:hypothetical protein